MEWLIVLMLILIGAILVVLEILVLPGINVAGILGFISIIAGVYFGYAYYGGVTGHLILAGTVVWKGRSRGLGIRLRPEIAERRWDAWHLWEM